MDNDTFSPESIRVIRSSRQQRLVEGAMPTGFPPPQQKFQVCYRCTVHSAQCVQRQQCSVCILPCAECRVHRIQNVKCILSNVHSAEE